VRSFPVPEPFRPGLKPKERFTVKTTTSSALLAAAVASMFAGAAFAGDKMMPKKDAKDTAAQIKCTGVNECKGKGACGGASHDCAGQNECKGKGWVTLTDKDCKAKGGTVVADAKK